MATGKVPAKFRRPPVLPLDEQALRILAVYPADAVRRLCFCWPSGRSASGCGRHGRACLGTGLLFERAALTVDLPPAVRDVLDALAALTDDDDDQEDDDDGD